MAKVFKAGTISVGGDKIRLTSKGTGKFAFTDSSNSDLFSTAIYDSEVSSLADHQNVDTLQRSSDISSLDIVKDSEVSSLNSALSALDSALQVKTFDISNNVESQTISWADGVGEAGSGDGFDSAAGAGDHGFDANTTVMVMTKAASGVALIAVQLVSTDANGFTVEFSESTGTDDKYDLVVMASN